ncbi:MAG: MarR family transcriptional regulator [Candidatus Borkfalkiaceae bacterium]|nr:MarR family transcriptional regulator [Clostridia bacterium]MDY6223312.1 MarR family transcriptional regulator [Christensenellaceae bacterium]
MNGETYLGKIQAMTRKMQNVVFLRGKKTFNNSEMRMLEEIVTAEKKKERLISTELADRVGVTRSAISQMVNRLSSEGLVKRVPDEVDRKIAYIELDGNAKELYLAQRKRMGDSVSKVIAEFGADKVNQMLKLVDEFSEAVYRNVR